MFCKSKVAKKKQKTNQIRHVQKQHNFITLLNKNMKVKILFLKAQCKHFGI